ncbi:MAG: hypothetical protein ACQXXD_03930 [Thermoplasmatota archaeon]|jgi:hypothetical protein
MTKTSDKVKISILLLLMVILTLSTLIPIVSAVNIDKLNGINKGPSYLPVIPLKNVFLINYDEDSYLDDFAYLAAIPSSVFQQNGRLFSYPLLFFDDPYEYEEDKERSLNARQGLDYFMEDWMSYCNGQLDQLKSVNVGITELDESWHTKEYFMIDSNNPYEIANKIALHDWSFSDSAVIAVIEDDFEKPSNFTSGFVKGKIPGGKNILHKTFYSNQLNKLNPRFYDFEVPEGYKYLKSRTWWSCLEIRTKRLPISFSAVIPPADPDSQIYCNYNSEWMQVAATAEWNIGSMDIEKAETYVYKSGSWRLGITDVPTEAGLITRYGRFIDILRNMIRGVTYQTDITIFPGVEIDIPAKTGFGCRDVNFKLTWDNPNINLGFSVIGPSGEEIVSISKENTDGCQELHLNQLGECLPDESYSVSVFALNELSSPIDFKVEYSWHQNLSKTLSDSLSSAAEGAVLASTLNIPLLYTSPSVLSEGTRDVLYKLGVKYLYLVDLGNHISNSAKKDVEDVASIKETYVESSEIYQDIMNLTGQNDIVFSTIDPWTKWYVPEMKPGDETEAGLFVGPAAYCAAHHGSPLLIVDNHPELSSALVWHNEFWTRHANGYKTPTVAQMYLTGKRVYDFLKKLGYDKEGMETMITVADQYDLGATWDRTFTGKAKPGRFFGHPVDTAYWISRSMFYPELIFSNPALNPDGISLIQGSESVRRKIFSWGSFGLKITKPSREESFKYPVLQMYVNPKHHLNDAFEKYYGFRYKSADNIVPGVTESFNSIDEGIVPGKDGAIWPDITVSEVIPTYLERGGYDSVFSTSFEAVTNNLNKGVILWFSASHGGSGGSGALLSWDLDGSSFGILPNFLSKRFGRTKETNPWRGYDWYLGSTENPDTMTMEVHGFIPALLGNPNLQGLFATGQDFWPSERPIYHALTNLPIIKWFMPKWAKDSSYYKDGMIISHDFGKIAVSGTLMTGLNLDDSLENIHSCGWLNTACLPAYKYLHLTMVRHGSSFQVIDPWPTSWYGSFWLETIPRDIILGDTVGEAYTKGISHVGILYITDPPQFWWDITENVCYFGDPDLRVFVPETRYSNSNYWEKGDTKPLFYDADISINGHMPYGATGYPNQIKPLSFVEKYIVLLIGLAIIIILLVIALSLGRKPKNN